MNIVRTLILSALGIGALAFATPSKADEERVYINGRTYYSDRYHHHHHHDWEHDREWQREHRGQVIIQNDSGVSVAFGGHPRYHHHYYHRDWDRP
jgi:hypothetical protein